MIRAISIIAIASLGGIASGPGAVMTPAGSTPASSMGPASVVDPLCGTYADVANGLRDAYEESRVAQGLTSAGVVIEVFASGTGTWTLVLVTPNGVSCLVSHGEGWRQTSPSTGVSAPMTTNPGRLHDL